jgi:hypothetical protein
MLQCSIGLGADRFLTVGQIKVMHQPPGYINLSIRTTTAPFHVFELGIFVFVTVPAEHFPIAAILSVVVVVTRLSFPAPMTQAASG